MVVRSTAGRSGSLLAKVPSTSTSGFLTAKKRIWVVVSGTAKKTTLAPV